MLGFLLNCDDLEVDLLLLAPVMDDAHLGRVQIAADIRLGIRLGLLFFFFVVVNLFGLKVFCFGMNSNSVPNSLMLPEDGGA